jgi:8-oxo-dGTP pyrophosphatase MutT (NUDIX family)
MAGFWFEQIRKLLEGHPAAPYTLEEGWRRAAVLAPLYVRDKELWLLLTRRTDSLAHHAGQISFPGGAAEPGEQDLLDTALRETREEIGLPRRAVIPLGRLSPVHVRPTGPPGFYVQPYVGAIPWPFELTPSSGEIAEIVEIPVPALMNPRVVEEREVERDGRRDRLLFYHYGRHVVWGATARILWELLGILSGQEASAS